jgi:glycosyltransferase involved in cell wall biosynthesis
MDGGAPVQYADVGERPAAPLVRGRAIRVLFTHPYFWPHVRRGAEREIHDLGTRVAAEGTEVRLLTSTPMGLTQRDRYGEMDVRYVRLPLPHALARRGLSDVAAFAAASLPFVATSRADLVHTWHYGDGWAAVQAKRVRRGRPVVLKLTGTVEPDRIEHVRIDRRLFREAIAGADAVWCNSPYAREAMAGFGVPMEVVPAGVDLDRFRPSASRSERPVVLCASAPDDPRKRLTDVVDAWPGVLAEVPDARLVLAGRASGASRAALLAPLSPDVAATVDLVGDLRDEALVAAYSSASAVVAPAFHEALGLSTIEALACGTPVAGARSGATADLVTPGIGALYEPLDGEGCAGAIVAAIALSGQPATVGACRAAAEPYGWDVIVPDVLRRWRALL